MITIIIAIIIAIIIIIIIIIINNDNNNINNNNTINNSNDVIMKLIKNAKSKYFFRSWLVTETNELVQNKKEKVFSIS